MRIENISKTYNNKIVLDKISLSVPKGKITAFIGPNGAGKSTALNIMSRLVLADSGEVFLQGKNIKEYKSNQIAKMVSILSQQNAISLRLKVKELVGFGRFPYSGSNLCKEDYEKIDEALKLMNLSELKDAFLDNLSGGQRQRAFIAMTIAQDTPIVLLDEPTNNLDIAHCISMMKNCVLLAKLGKSIVIVLHELNFAAFYADYIAAFKDGKLLYFDESQKIMQKDILQEIYGVDFEILEINNKKMCVYY